MKASDYKALTLHDQKIFKLFSWDNRVSGQSSFESIHNNEIIAFEKVYYILLF